LKTFNLSVSKLAHLLLPLVGLVGLTANAAEAPPPPATVEAYLCNYNAGKARADLNSATTFYKQQAAKAGITIPPSYLWTRNKGTSQFGLIWFTAHENLAAFAAFADASAASSEMAAVGTRYDSVVTCQANLAAVMQVSARNVTPGGPTTINSYACNFRPGASMDSMGDLRAHIKSVNDARGDSAPIGVYQLNPATAGPETPDVVVFAVHQNMAAWAANVAFLNGDPDGQALVRHFTAILDCNMSLWDGEQVITPST